MWNLRLFLALHERLFKHFAGKVLLEIIKPLLEKCSSKSEPQMTIQYIVLNIL